jgi:predicted PhzF superfamily epimerase YddE/YHI9
MTESEFVVRDTLPVPFFQIDAFTATPFAGNPAAVVLLPASRDSSWMQTVAQEMNLSETAFVYPEEGQLRLRWFTPAVEVDLCGHATLATMHALKDLYTSNALPELIRSFWNQGTVQFASRSGVLTAECLTDGIVLNFPATTVAPCDPPSGLLSALGVLDSELRFCGKSRFDYLLEVSRAAVVRKLRPDMRTIAELPVRGVIVTALGDAADHDFLSRFFAPGAGVPEDPVTGSAHCALAPYWAPQFGRNVLFGFQASPRGGHVRMELQGDRVRLQGQAVTVIRGQLLQ